MHSVQGNLLQSLRAVEEFLDTHAVRLDGVVKSGTRQKLGETISALEMYVVEQAESSLAAQGATQLNNALRVALVRDHMAPIARLVQADLPPAPQVDALRMPRAGWSIERLAAAAHAMANAAAPYAEDFVKAGMRPDFVTRLIAAADTMVQAGRRAGADARQVEWGDDGAQDHAGRRPEARAGDRRVRRERAGERSGAAVELEAGEARAEGARPLR